MTIAPRPTPPRCDCADVQDCFESPSEIGWTCTFGPICGTCVVYRSYETSSGLLRGTCRIRTERGDFACTAAICDSYIPRQGAPNSKGVVPTEQERLVALGVAPAAKGGRSTGSGANSRRPAAVPPIPVRAAVPDGPVGDFDMTRDELKALIREAMDEERGGAEVPLGGKWEGGTVLIKPADPALQAKELPVDALFHKVVMVRDRLRVLEQRLNAHSGLSPAEKVELQAYITKCYGSLTTFNVLFRRKEDQFVGERGSE